MIPLTNRFCTLHAVARVGRDRWARRDFPRQFLQKAAKITKELVLGVGGWEFDVQRSALSIRMISFP
jgi:hypothetical protein